MGSPTSLVFCVFLILSSYIVGNEEDVRRECGFTRYPAACVQTLTKLGSGDQKFDFLSALINNTLSETQIKLEESNFQNQTAQSQHAKKAVDYCHQLMEMSVKRLNQSLYALTRSQQRNKPDIQTWLSAVITFQQTCKDSLEEHVPSTLHAAETYKKMESLSEMVSNSLALANRIAGEKSPRCRRRLLVQGDEQFPVWLTAANRKLLQSAEIKADIVVAKDGTGNFKSVYEAIDAAATGTGRRFVIYVKSGVYYEKINVYQGGITLIGDGKYKTIITGSSSVGGGTSFEETATFTITGDGFLARDISFQNTAGPNGEQAVALTMSSDRSVLYRCSIVGYQDTLYALSLRQFYTECDIYGTIDFIFGDAAAVFQSCNLILRQPREGAYNVILAQGRTTPEQNTGFSIQKCTITVGSDLSPVKTSYQSFLGRPWKQYSTAVVKQSKIDSAIERRGWVEWPGADGSTYANLDFAEYANVGPGAVTSGRVNWPGIHVMDGTAAEKFTVAKFIDGTSWLPSMGYHLNRGCDVMYPMNNSHSPKFCVIINYYFIY